MKMNLTPTAGLRLRRVQNMHWSEHASCKRIYGKLLPFPQKLTNCRLQFSAQTSTALQRNSQKRISRQALVCLPFVGGNIFSPTADKPNVFRFRFKSAEWAGNFVVRSQEVILRIISFRRPFGLLVWNFGRPRGLIVSASGADRAALRNKMLGVRSFLRASRPIGSNDGDDEDDKDQFIAISL